MFRWTLKLFLIVGVLFIALFAFLMYYVFSAIPSDVSSELSEIECNGTILSIKEEQPCFSILQVGQQRDTVNLSVSSCGMKNDFFDYVATGDKLVKPKGELLLIVTKNSGETKTFPYPFELQ